MAVVQRADIDPDVHFLVGDGSEPWKPEVVVTDASKNPQGGRPARTFLSHVAPRSSSS